MTTKCKKCLELRKDKKSAQWFCKPCLSDMPAKIYPCQICGAEWSTCSENLFLIELENGEPVDVRACRSCQGF